MFWEKLILLCNQNNTSPSALCRDLGLSTTAAVKWKRGATPYDRTLEKIASYFNVSANFFKDESESSEIGNYDTELVQLRFIPVYESASAGFGTIARSEVVGYVPCAIRTDREADETIGIRVQGDSMYPKIEDGDTVVVHKQTSVDSGTLAVVLVDNEEGYIKRVEYGPDWINLVSLNPMYPPMRFKGSEVLRVQVVGRVTKVIKDV